MGNKTVNIKLDAELHERFRACFDGVQRHGQPYLTKGRVFSTLLDAWCSKIEAERRGRGAETDAPARYVHRRRSPKKTWDVPHTRYVPMSLDESLAERFNQCVAACASTGATKRSVVADLLDAWCLAVEAEHNNGEPWPLLRDPDSPGIHLGDYVRPTV